MLIVLAGCMMGLLPLSAQAQVVECDPAALAAAFQDAQKVDLRTSRVPSVVVLRDQIKIPPPSDPVLVKVFKREALPEVLKPAFSKPGIAGVTLLSRFVAIIQTDLHKEYQDILSHELVHAYISLVSPEPLPFWFQEGSAVYFSMGKARKFYGQPSKEHPGMMVGRTVEVDPVYRQKLHSFQYLVESAGDAKFRKWFRQAVMSGKVDARTLTGLSAEVEQAPVARRRSLPVWPIVAIGLAVVVVLVAGFYASRRDAGYY